MGRKIGDNRSFKVEISSLDRGATHKPTRYLNKTPFGAARKAATKLFNRAPDTVTEVRFILRETTKSTMSANQKHYYVGKRVREADPLGRLVKKADSSYRVFWITSVRALEESSVADLLAKIRTEDETVPHSQSRTASSTTAAPRTAGPVPVPVPSGSHKRTHHGTH